MASSLNSGKANIGRRIGMKANELLEQYAAGIRDFTGADLSEEDLEGANLSGFNVSIRLLG